MPQHPTPTAHRSGLQVGKRPEPVADTTSSAATSHSAHRFGAVQRKEQERILQHRRNRVRGEQEPWVGLCLSGGGIRSASFGLGVLQALNRSGLLDKIDYLSTVSGGGYIGSTLTWFTHLGSDRTWILGERRQGARSHSGMNVLDYIRQHGNYLTPGDGLGTASLVATAVRSVLLSTAIYSSLLIAVFLLLIHLGWLDSVWNPILRAGVVFFGILGGLFWIYGISTRFATGSTSLDYWLRVFGQMLFGFLLTAAVTLAFIGSLPVVSSLLSPVVGGRLGAATAGATSVVAGAVGGVMEFLRQRRADARLLKFLAAQRVWISAILLTYGLLLLAYTIAGLVPVESWSFWATFSLLFALFTGVTIDTNLFGVGRMYRDRLMETFMPNPEAVDSGEWKRASRADGARLADMCSVKERGPYHLVNCNIVLVDSEKTKYRGRGGDSFILSPLFCGSDATYWYDTHDFIRGHMTLATAIAISGAAANPNSGVTGSDPTRNRLVSFLMAFLNLRLGYFARNPYAKGLRRWLARWTRPNFIYPGIVQGLLGQRLNAYAGYIELSDGGHFDNTGLYEMARRRLDTIVISEAGADPKFSFADLGNAVERIKVDFGYYIEFDQYPLKDLLPGSSKASPSRPDLPLAERGFAVGTVDYGDKKGTIVFLKATFIDDLPADLLAYRNRYPVFPNQSTSDQFFDEIQLEAYRELGYQLCKRMVKENAGGGWIR